MNTQIMIAWLSLCLLNFKINSEYIKFKPDVSIYYPNPEP